MNCRSPAFCFSFQEARVSQFFEPPGLTSRHISSTVPAAVVSTTSCPLRTDICCLFSFRYALFVSIAKRGSRFPVSCRSEGRRVLTSGIAPHSSSVGAPTFLASTRFITLHQAIPPSGGNLPPRLVCSFRNVSGGADRWSKSCPFFVEKSGH